MIPPVAPQHQEIIYLAKFNEHQKRNSKSRKLLSRASLDELIEKIFSTKLDYLIETFFKINHIPDLYRTDCVINFNILCRLLCKKKRAIDMLFASRVTYSFNHTVGDISLDFNDLFTGAILCSADLRTLRELACHAENEKEHEDYILSKFNSVKQGFEKHLEELLKSLRPISKKAFTAGL